MLRLRTCLFVFCAIAICCAACDTGPSAEELAATHAVETNAAAQAQTAIAIAQITDTPTITPTYTPIPTDTPTPSPTLTATQTRRPTNTPTITQTPGPYSFFDDFSTDSSGWLFCESCEWTNGTLVVGPFDPSSFFHVNFCFGCGLNTFYRVAVDITFIEGEVDRTFGIIFAESDDSSYYLGISPWGGYIIQRYDFAPGTWTNLAGQWSGSVVGGYGTNHFEVFALPNTSGDLVEYWLYLNGDLIYTVYNRPQIDTGVGIAMAYHAQVAAYDNWEYVVIEP